MITAPDRARLEAYVDGALAPEEAAQVEAHLAAAPEDRRFVDRLVAMNAMLGAAYDAPLRAPLPDGLRRAVTGRPAARRGVIWTGAGLALAASVALIVGVSLGQRLAEPATVVAAGPVAAASPLNAPFETAASGSAARLPGGAEITLVGTFLDGDGRPCREFEIADDAVQGQARGIACRGAEGWTILAAVAEDARREAREAFVPASGAAAPALDVVLDSIDAGMVLAPDEEAALLASGWGRP